MIWTDDPDGGSRANSFVNPIKMAFSSRTARIRVAKVPLLGPTQIDVAVAVGGGPDYISSFREFIKKGIRRVYMLLGHGAPWGIGICFDVVRGAQWLKQTALIEQENLMLGNFTYHNPTIVHFGPQAIDQLAGELEKYGPTVMLTYGGGSIKRAPEGQKSLYDQVIDILVQTGKTVVEEPGVMSNPTSDKLIEGAQLARENDVDLILAVGGGSVIDYAKGVAVSAWCDEDPWEKYYKRMESPANRIIPVGDILTMSGTGGEMNGGSVITNHEQKLKIGHVFGPENMPKFAIMNPEWTFTVPPYQMRAGIFDAFNHITETYFCGTDDNTSDYVMEGLMRSLIHSSRIAMQDAEDYEARSNISWVSTWALNTFVGCGKNGGDWEVHMIGQAIGAFTDATHGMTLSAVALPYYRRVMPYGLPKFARFATAVWGVDPAGKTEEELAQVGLDTMSDWMDEIGAVKHASELGVTPDMFDGIADATFLLTGGYKRLTHEDVVDILRESE